MSDEFEIGQGMTVVFDDTTKMVRLTVNRHSIVFFTPETLGTLVGWTAAQIKIHLGKDLIRD